MDAEGSSCPMGITMMEILNSQEQMEMDCLWPKKESIADSLRIMSGTDMELKKQQIFNLQAFLSMDKKRKAKWNSTELTSTKVSLSKIFLKGKGHLKLLKESTPAHLEMGWNMGVDSKNGKMDHITKDIIIKVKEKAKDSF